MYDVVADAAHDGTSNLAQTASADDDHRYIFFLSNFADDLARLTATLRPHSA